MLDFRNSCESGGKGMHENFRFCEISKLSIEGAFVINYKTHKDGRGSFTKIATPELFSITGGAARIAQVNHSSNLKQGTWRGIHVQGDPHNESKIINCIRGSANDYLVDLRKSSPTFGKHIKVVLEQDKGLAILIGPGIGHGYQTLVPETDFVYLHNKHWAPDATHVLDFQDRQLDLKLEMPVTEISNTDLMGSPLNFFKTLEW